MTSINHLNIFSISTLWGGGGVAFWIVTQDPSSKNRGGELWVKVLGSRSNTHSSERHDDTEYDTLQTHALSAAKFGPYPIHFILAWLALCRMLLRSRPHLYHLPRRIARGHFNWNSSRTTKGTKQQHQQAWKTTESSQHESRLQTRIPISLTNLTPIRAKVVKVMVLTRRLALASCLIRKQSKPSLCFQSCWAPLASKDDRFSMALRVMISP